MNVRKTILRRVYLAFVLVGVFALLIVLQVLKLQVIQGSEWRSKADSVSTNYINVEAVRGNIFANDGSLLATSLPEYEVRMDVNADGLTDEVFYSKVDSLAWSLANFYKDKTYKEYSEQLRWARKNGSRYHLIRRGVNFPELKIIKDFPIFNLGRFKGGLVVEQKNRRVKPFKSLASRAIGYVKEDIKVGLEGAYDDYLGGVTGKRLMQRLPGGLWMPINDDDEIAPKDGYDVITTIDVNIQDVAHNALMKQLTLHDADHGSVVLMEVQTGEIRAIANLSRLAEGVYAEAYNYAVGESTEPGSTFKLASIIAALEDGYVEIEDSIDTDSGFVQYYDLVLKDSKVGGYGKIPVSEAFAVSSNVAISKIIFENYGNKPQKFINHLHRMKLDEPLGLNIAGEGVPRVKSPDDKYWSGVSLPWISVGYEITLTPLQTLVLYNAVANKGRMIAPIFVKEVRQLGKPVEKFKARVINSKIASDKTLKDVRQLLEMVVEEGTAVNLRNASYKIAGKTGTAQIAQGSTGYKLNQTIYQASFAGYFPADNPKYSCIVVVSAPSKAVYYGNLVAGPIFKEIADKVYASGIEMHKAIPDTTDESVFYHPPIAKRGFAEDTRLAYKDIGVKPNTKGSDPWVRPWKDGDKIELLPHKNIRGLVPNVLGMTLMDAMFLLENEGLSVEVNGSGKVTSQSIAHGTKIRGMQTVELELK